MEGDQNLSAIKVEPIEIKSETEDELLVEITAQSITGGQEFEDTKGPISGSGVIKTEPTEIKSEPKDEPFVEFTAQDVVDGEKIKEESDNDSQSQGLPKEPKIEADNQSVFHALDDNKGLVMKYTLGESQSESESVDLSTLNTSKKRRIIGKQDEPEVKKEPLSIVSPSEYTILESKRVQCNYCGTSTKALPQMRWHIRNNHRDTVKSYKCPFCPFTSKHGVSKHIISKHKGDEDNIENFVCHTCGKRFKFKYRLARHVKTHRTIEELMQMNDIFVCHTCGKRFKFKRHLVAHIKTHRTVKELKQINEIYKCEQCSKMFPYKNSLAKHSKFCHNKNHDEPLSKVQCDHCAYKCSSKQTLMFHIQKKHTPVAQLKTLKCPECDFTTKFMWDFKNHKNRSHRRSFKWPYQILQREDNKYNCNKCAYWTYRSGSLKNHSLSHLKAEEIQYFYCFHCNFKYKYRKGIITHIRRHFEREEVEFECHICDFKTKKRQIYSHHIGEHNKKLKS